MRKIKKRIWDFSSARDYIARVNLGKVPFGLKYLSACDYLRIHLGAAKMLAA